jgi:hypothetical protein
MSEPQAEGQAVRKQHPLAGFADGPRMVNCGDMDENVQRATPLKWWGLPGIEPERSPFSPPKTRRTLLVP